MASNYGLNFGFRRSDEHVRMSEGGYRTPTSGVLLQGTAVEIDTATPGYLKVPAAAATLRPGSSGILLQEEQQFFSIYESNIYDSERLNKTKANTLSVMTSGAGVKVWFQNTAAVTRIDGHTVPAVTMVDMTGMADQVMLGWNGTQWAVTALAAQAWFRVLSFSPVTATNLGAVEAVMLG